MIASPLLSWVRFLRLPLAPTAAWDAVACFALALAAAEVRLASVPVLDWVLLIATALLTYGFGMGLNDLADRDRDRTLAPDRPLPSGRIHPAPAWGVVAILGVGAVALGGGPSGRREAVIAAVALAAVYDLVAKRFLVPGVLAMGLVRFANASVAVWPLVIAGAAPGWTLLAPATIGLYAAAVTLWSTTEEVESTARRVVARVLSAVAFVGAGGLSWLASGGPTLGLIVAFGVATSVAFGRRPKPGPAKRQVLEMLLALYFLSMCLATAADRGSAAGNLGALGVAVALIFVTQIWIRAVARAAKAEQE